MKISTRIKNAMKEKGMTQADLSKTSGISKSTLSEWLNDKYEPKQNSIYILSESLGVDPTWLMGLDVDKKPKLDIEPIYNQLEQPRQKKVYEFADYQLEEQNSTQTVVTLGKTAAGVPIEQESIEEEHEVASVPVGAEVALVVDGNSMEPNYQSGDIVFYKKTSEIENGELAVVYVEDEGVTFKKVKFDFENEKIILQSLNDEYSDRVLNGNQVRVLGKALN